MTTKKNLDLVPYINALAHIDDAKGMHDIEGACRLVLTTDHGVVNVYFTDVIATDVKRFGTHRVLGSHEGLVYSEPKMERWILREAIVDDTDESEWTIVHLASASTNPKGAMVAYVLDARLETFKTSTYEGKGGTKPVTISGWLDLDEVAS